MLRNSMPRETSASREPLAWFYKKDVLRKTYENVHGSITCSNKGQKSHRCLSTSKCLNEMWYMNLMDTMQQAKTWYKQDLHIII